MSSQPASQSASADDIRHSNSPIGKLVDMKVPKDNPADVDGTRNVFMRSEWYKDPAKRKLSWNPLPWLAYRLMYKGSVGPKTGKIGYIGYWEQHLQCLPRALVPMALHYVSMKVFNITWHPVFAYFVYSLSLLISIIGVLKWLNRLTEEHGFLDGAAPRDYVPDLKLNSTLIVLIATVTLRVALCCFAAYDRYEVPHISPWLPVHGFMYSVILDGWFYLWHRNAHEVDWMWKLHKTHHMTKHSTPLLSAFADEYQDTIEIAVVPMLTWLVYPLDFFSWYIISMYILYIEATGHSGIRIQFFHPFNYPILNWFGMDLTLEDHDLHHRQGWRKSSNYGKQTRVWDTLFGTKRARVEVVPENCL